MLRRVSALGALAALLLCSPRAEAKLLSCQAQKVKQENQVGAAPKAILYVKCGDTAVFRELAPGEQPKTVRECIVRPMAELLSSGRGIVCDDDNAYVGTSIEAFEPVSFEELKRRELERPAQPEPGNALTPEMLKRLLLEPLIAPPSR